MKGRNMLPPLKRIVCDDVIITTNLCRTMCIVIYNGCCWRETARFLIEK